MTSLGKIVGKIVAFELVSAVDDEAKDIHFDEAWAYQRGQISGIMKSIEVMVNLASDDGKLDIGPVVAALAELSDKVEPGGVKTREEYYKA